MSEFLQDPRTHAPPQSFRMGDLLHEMQEIEQRNVHHTPVRGKSQVPHILRFAGKNGTLHLCTLSSLFLLREQVAACQLYMYYTRMVVSAHA